MKKIFLVAIMLLCGALIHVIADEVKVTMKDGTVFTAELKEFVPTDHITVVVGGIESVVPISEVVSIDKANVVQPPTPMSISNSHSVYGMYEITDTKQYPDSFILNVGSQQLTMVLIRGGWFNMGYDGHNSLFWDTEPIHKVTLSSYYISKQLHKVKYKKNADDLLSNLAKTTNLPYRLPTEAEWEYVALMPFAESIFSEENLLEWCSDFWGPYGVGEQINPQGPKQGKSHVLRAFSRRNEKWQRYRGFIDEGKETSNDDAYMRIAISADSINF